MEISLTTAPASAGNTKENEDEPQVCSKRLWRYRGMEFALIWLGMGSHFPLGQRLTPRPPSGHYLGMTMDREKLIADLEAIRRDATMQTAHFSRIFPEPGQLPYPTCEQEVTAFIEERTRIWRDTWIVGMLDVMIEDIKSETARYRAGIRPGKETEMGTFFIGYKCQCCGATDHTEQVEAETMLDALYNTSNMILHRCDAELNSFGVMYPYQIV